MHAVLQSRNSASNVTTTEYMDTELYYILIIALVVVILYVVAGFAADVYDMYTATRRRRLIDYSC